MTGRGYAGLDINDGTGAIRENIFATDDGSDAGFQAWDSAAQLQTKMGVLAGSSGFGFQAFGADGQPVWQAP